MVKELLQSQTKEKKYVPPPGKDFNFLDYNVVLDKVMGEFDSYGYNSACQLTQSLYSQDQISLMVKSKLINELTE